MTKAKKTPLRRITAFLLVCVMLLLEFAMLPMPRLFAADSSGLTLLLNQYSSDLYIYNYLCYTSAGGTDETGAGNGAYVLKGPSNVNVFIGDALGAEGDARPLDSDIQVQLSQTSFASGKKITANPIYNGKRSLSITVTENASIDTLVVKSGAKVTLTLQANLTVSGIVLENGASLEIRTGNKTLTVSSVIGTGNLTVSGGGTVMCQTLSAGTLILNNATIDGSGTGTVTASGDITVGGATLQNLSLFGYDYTAEGNKTITFNGGHFSEVATVGVTPDSNATVTVKGLSTVSTSLNTNYIYDYAITYWAGDTELTPQSGWATAYRVHHDSLTGGNSEILGYIADNTVHSAATVLLPSYDTAFFGYDGWKLGEEKITELGTAQRGDVQLSAILKAGTVTVEMILGYTPTDATNDQPLPPYRETTTSAVGEVVALSTPVRFGYVFKGWRITSGTLHGVYFDSYTVQSGDLDAIAGSDTFSLTMEAVWEADRFPIRLMLGTVIDTAMLSISTDGGNTFIPFTAFTASLPSGVIYNDKMLSFSDYIAYGETLEEYFNRILGGYPVLLDRTGVYTFASWYNTGNGATVTGNDVYRHGNGILLRPNGDTLTAWQKKLKEFPISFAPLWVETTHEYTLSVNNKTDFTVLVNGSTPQPDGAGNYKVTLGSNVSLRVPISSKYSITHWSFSTDLSITERTYTVGDQFLYYDFNMPASDVTAIGHKKNDTTTGEQLYVDLSESPVTFAENVSYNNRNHAGFWLTKEADNMTSLFYEEGKGYFYIWNFSEPFHVTTYGNATKNQLTLVNAMTGGVYLENCNLIATDAYLAHAVGRRLNGKLLEKAGSGAPSSLTADLDWSAYGNIVLNNRTHKQYTTNLYFRGTNTVASIMASHYNGTSAYAGTLNLIGDGIGKSFLTLGSVVVLGILEVKALTITEYNDNFEYLFYTVIAQMNCDDIRIRGCHITATTKRIYNSFNYISVYDNSVIDIGSVFVAYALRTYGTSYVRVRGDIVGYYYLLRVEGNSSLVVDGGVYTMSHTASYGESVIKTTGYVIVRGLGIASSRLEITGNSTVIANMVSASRGATFSAGTLVTNFISNPVTRPPALSGDDFVIRPYTVSTKSSADNDIYYNYSNKQKVASEFLFSGSSIYLFGYHKGTNGEYDVSSNIKTDTANPVKAIADALLDANGDLLPSLRKTPDQTAVRSAAEAAMMNAAVSGLYQNSDCIMMGDSTHTESSQYAKKVTIKGGNLYATGNVTFYNTTTVTGGTVVCGGRFGSKRDVTVSGGTITASEIGISSNLTVSENGLERYSKLVLTGGTLVTDRIGAHSVSSSGVLPKGVPDLAITASLSPREAASITVASSLYANYLFDSAVYAVAAGNPVSLDFIGSFVDGALSDLTLASEITLISPTLKSASGSAMWLYDNAGGEKITSVSITGLVNGDSALSYVYQDRLSFAVYAAKGSYTLAIKGDYQNTGFDVSYGGNTYDKNTTFSVDAGGTVTIRLDNTDIFDRTIVWYTDAAGVIHNALKNATSTLDRNTRTITFRMPYSDTEIHVTSEFTLLLDRYPISFTETGFALEAASADRRADSVFDYLGHILITQGSTAKTYNRIFFESENAGNKDSGRRITLYELNQSSLGVLYGTVIANGADVVFTVQNRAGKKVCIAPVQVPVNASVRFVGATANASDNTLAFYSFNSLGGYLCVGDTVAGTITYENMTLTTADTASYSQFARSTSTSTISPNTVTFRNCLYTATRYYTYDTLAGRMNKVVIEGCTFSITGSPDLSSALTENCYNLVLTGSTLSFSYGGTRSGKHPFHISTSVGTLNVTVHNSTMTVVYNRVANSSATNLEEAGLYGNVTVSGNSVVSFSDRISFKSLVLCDTASLIVEDGEGYLLCPSITLRDNATISAGYVFLSGFVVGSYVDKQAVLNALQAGSAINGTSYSGLLVEGGTLRAKYFVGGDRNAKLAVTGGRVETAGFGTLGALVGYGKYIPNLTESEFVYSYTFIPVGTKITVSGGEVVISDGGYLGGMNATVSVTGGTVTLQGSAVLGLTDLQTTTLLNHASSQGNLLKNAVSVTLSGGTVLGNRIHTPYGDTTISDTAYVNVETLSAQNGSVTIRDTADHVTNDYVGTDRLHPLVGVKISDTLEALTVTVTSNAIVYANRAYAYADGGSFGSLTVSGDAHLYTGAEYGSRGNGETEVKEDGGKIYGYIRYTIVYELNGDNLDRATNDPRNPADYLFGNETIILYDPVRPGYDFVGWYMESDFSGTPFTSLTAATAKNQKIYAKWTPKKVRFIIEISTDVLGNDVDLYEETIGFGIDGTISGNTFTYAKVAEIAYLDTVLGRDEGHITLDDYALRSYSIGELVVKNTYTFINGATTVTKDWVNQGTVTLAVTQTGESREELHLDLNLSNKRPVNAIFNNTSKPDSATATVMSSYCDYGKTIGTANGFTTLGALVTPSAPGYIFSGWYTDKACTGTPIDASFVIMPEGPTVFYAKWVAKEYYFAFDAGENTELSENNKITLDKEKPDSASGQQKLVFKISYDQPLSSAELVYTFVDGAYLAFGGATTTLASLPTAWVQGFTHGGNWSFTDTASQEKVISLANEFNLTVLNTSDWSNISTDTSGAVPAIAISFMPVIKRVTVTYDVNGGTLVGIDQDTTAWKDSYQSITKSGSYYVMQAAVYKKALLGYTGPSVTANAAYTLENSTTCPHGLTYGVVSTTPLYFKENGAYHEDDYRFEIGKKGYTFKGWRLMRALSNGTLVPETDALGNEILIGYLPQYEDITVQAVWEANTYDVTLKPYDQSASYHSAFNVSTDVHIGFMTVGNEITGLDSIWPSRASEWYAYAPGTTPDENQKRYLLGFTFDPLDPGIADSANAAGYAAYQKYASDVTTLLNHNAVLTHSAGSETIGSLFALPPDATYGDPIVNGTNFVPDYPSGSSVTLYAIYRERSLVFVEYYTDGDGEIHKRVMSSFPWDKWSDYADKNATSPNAYITRTDKPDDLGDYALIGWRFNASNISNTAYPETVWDEALSCYTVSPDDCRALYASMLPLLKKEAEDLGTYDIMVYSVWAAYQNIDSAALENDTNPLVNVSSSVIDIAIPPSMQAGVLNHTVADIPNLTLVDLSELTRFNSALGNTTVAIKATLYDETGIWMEETYLKETGNTPEKLFTLAVEGNWRIVFTLYHSSVVTESALHTFSMTLGFEDDKLANQKITFSEINLFLSPTEYTVDYGAILPENPIVTDWSGFDAVSHHRVEADVPYGSALLDTLPIVEGFTPSGVWKSSTGDLAYGAPLVQDTLAEAAVNGGSDTLAFTTEWTVNDYLLSVTDALLARWNIYYGDARTPLTENREIAYRTKLTFAPKTVGEYPEFVRLVTASVESSLDLSAEFDALSGEWTLSMPANALDAFFNRLITLYLENGSIAIGEEGYSQNGNAVTWHGDYTVLMNAANTATVATDNRLSLSGALLDRAITLGNLNIASKDAIALSDHTSVTLTNTGLVTATNILVPETAEITLSGGSLSLAHSADRAAIGGSEAMGANGTITLSDVTLSLILTQTYASGIGSGNQTAGGNAITLTNCAVTVKETSSSDVFHGAWIGGIGVDSVTLVNTSLALAAGSDEMLGPTVLEADTITVTGSSLGTSANPLIDPIHASDFITITASTLYQSLSKGIAIGTDSGRIEIEDSFLQCNVTNPTALYSGKLVLLDPAADVTIAGVQILETAHGNIVITKDGATQGSESFAHNKNYLILHELSGDASPSLTVNSLSLAASITLKAISLASLTANADTLLTVEDFATVNGIVKVSDGSTLTVTANGTLTLSGGFDGTTSGSFAQTGGSLVGTDLAIGGNMTLSGVTATASGSLGSLGTAGVTTVTLTDSTVTAERIGALGAQNETFTFVKLTDTSYTGRLVEDLYRLDYVIDAGFTTSHLPTVLRKETVSGVTTYTPSSPAAPTGGAGFLFWYIKKPDSSIVAINSSYDPTLETVAGLTASLIAYAEAADTDGTRTLKIYAFMNLSIEGILEDGKLLTEGEFTGAASSITLPAKGKWTAKFTVSGSMITGSAYVLKLASPLAAGTKLTLGVMSENIPTYYYYIVIGNETEIALSSFKRMGSSDAPTLLDGEAGKELYDVLLLVADFSSCDNNEEKTNAISLAVVANGSAISEEELHYETEQASTVTGGNNAANVAYYGDSTLGRKMLYLILTFGDNAPEIPYGATVMTADGSTATRLNDKTFFFVLTAADSDYEATLHYTVNGFVGGYYPHTLSLVTADRGSDNPLGISLAESAEELLTVEEKEVTMLDVYLLTVDGEKSDTRVLQTAMKHTLTFGVRTTGKLTVFGTLVNENGGNTEAGFITVIEGEADTIVEFSERAPSGTYRVIFSLDDNATEDDVIFTFVLN